MEEILKQAINDLNAKNSALQKEIDALVDELIDLKDKLNDWYAI